MLKVPALFFASFLILFLAEKAVSEADYVLGGQKRAAAEPAEAEPPAKKAKIEKAEAPPAPAEPEKVYLVFTT